MKLKNVIEIIDDYNIMINYGYKNGAEIGDIINIVEKGNEVIDPNTNTSIGTLNPIKETLEITSVHENFSICSKVLYRDYSPFENPLNRTQTIKSFKKLSVDNSEMTSRKIVSKEPIKVGDLVEIK